MTDQECAAVLRRVLNNDDYVHLDDELAAYKRAIEVLEAKPKPPYDVSASASQISSGPHLQGW